MYLKPHPLTLSKQGYKHRDATGLHINFHKVACKHKCLIVPIMLCTHIACMHNLSKV